MTSLPPITGPGDYWDLIEAALIGLPESDRLREPALASFDHLKDRVLARDRAPGLYGLCVDMADALTAEEGFADIEGLLARLREIEENGTVDDKAMNQ